MYNVRLKKYDYFLQRKKNIKFSKGDTKTKNLFVSTEDMLIKKKTKTRFF